VLNLAFLPVVWLSKPFVGRKRAEPSLVKWFYKTPEWKRLRYAHRRQATVSASSKWSKTPSVCKARTLPIARPMRCCEVRRLFRSKLCEFFHNPLSKQKRG
jgi:hypothetical protein